MNRLSRTKLTPALAQIFINNGFTLSIAESCTGGLLSHEITNIPGCSLFFKLSLVAYANFAKTQILHINPQIITRYGAVSSQTAIAMAKGVKKLGKTTASIALTGIAGPGGGTPQKPVGTVFIAVTFKSTTIQHHCLFKGSRLQVKQRACQKALEMMIQLIKDKTHV